MSSSRTITDANKVLSEASADNSNVNATDNDAIANKVVDCVNDTVAGDEANDALVDEANDAALVDDAIAAAVDNDSTPKNKIIGNNNNNTSENDFEPLSFFDRVRRDLTYCCSRELAVLCLLLHQSAMHARQHGALAATLARWRFAVRFKGDATPTMISLDALLLLLLQTFDNQTPIERFYVSSGSSSTKPFGSVLSVPCAIGRMLLAECRRAAAALSDQERSNLRHQYGDIRPLFDTAQSVRYTDNVAPLNVDLAPWLRSALCDNAELASRHSVPGVGVVLAVNVDRYRLSRNATARTHHSSSITFSTLRQLPFRASPLLHWIYSARGCNELLEVLWLAHCYAAGVLGEQNWNTSESALNGFADMGDGDNRCSKCADVRATACNEAVINSVAHEWMDSQYMHSADSIRAKRCTLCQPPKSFMY